MREFLQKNDIDVLCLQEVKSNAAGLAPDLKYLDGFESHFYFAESPGYSGVALYSRGKPIEVIRGIGIEEFDREGRVILSKYKNFNLINFYFPHSRRGLERLDFKLKFNEAFLEFVKQFDKKRLICCGDFNVAHNDIDLARPKDNRKNAGFTEVEREWMDRFLDLGLIDVYRKLYPEKQEFTWWSQRAGVRARNIGWRIDYFLAFPEMFERVKDCRIMTEVYGSDHCPVILEVV